MFIPKVEKSVGIEVYATSSLGIGGVIRQCVEDFVVEELLVDGSRAEVARSVVHPVLGSSLVKNRFLFCVLVKKNWDMFQAVRMVADQLGVSAQQVHVAGIKDAKAVTAQHIAVKGISAEDVQKINIKGIAVLPIGYLRSRLSPYYLLGNNFSVVVRGVSHSKSAIKKRITETVKELDALGGVPNFFGHQRFGTTRPITHLVGKAMVKGNFRKAAMLFLAKPSVHEHPESRQAREQLRATHDFRQAIKNFPKQLRYERLMLKHLAERPDDFVGAFRRLPVKLRLLFPQAYQSYFFNRFLSRRITNGFSLNRAEVGDFVVNVERSGLSIVTMRRIANVESLADINRAIEAGKMRLALPLVGVRQCTSQGVQGEIEKQILEDEEISADSFRIGAMPETTTKGELRTAVTPLNSFLLEEIFADSGELMRYGVCVSFWLHRGSYATILLRELMKTSNPIKAGF